MSTNLILCILAIVVSIVVGWKLKFNTGIIAMLFALVTALWDLKLTQSLATGQQQLYST